VGTGCDERWGISPFVVQKESAEDRCGTRASNNFRGASELIAEFKGAIPNGGRSFAISLELGIDLLKAQSRGVDEFRIERSKTINEGPSAGRSSPYFGPPITTSRHRQENPLQPSIEYLTSLPHITQQSL
jgi:hypothetical protein